MEATDRPDDYSEPVARPQFPKRSNGMDHAEIDRLYRRIRNASLEFVCSKIEFLLAPGYHTVAFHGTGIVRAAAGRGFDVIMVGTGHSQFVDDLNIFAERKPGEKPNYYQVRFADWEGREWVGSGWVRPYMSKGWPTALDGKPLELRATLEAISTGLNRARPAVGEEIYQFLVPDAGSLPWTQGRLTTVEGPKGTIYERRMCYHVSSIDGVSVLLEEADEEGALQVSVASDACKLPPFIDVQILQALQFVTGRPLHYTLLCRNGVNQTRLRLVGPVSKIVRSRLPLPVAIRGPGDSQRFWAVFDALLKYLICAELNPFYHQFGDVLVWIMDASTRNTPTFALMLSVGVEAILPFCENAKPTDAIPRVSEEDIKALKQYLSGWNGSANAVSRVLGFVDKMKDWGTSDRLRQLRRGGIITQPQLNAWEKLRHRVAHGDLWPKNEDELDPVLLTVVTMFYRIVIGETDFKGELAE